MTGSPDADRRKGKPYLIERTEDGYRLLVREMRYNSQNYPVVTATDCGETFRSPAAARAYAREHYGAAAGEFASK
jgi:hypothetical protein